MTARQQLIEIAILRDDYEMYRYATSRKTSITNIRRRLSTMRLNPEMK